MRDPIQNPRLSALLKGTMPFYVFNIPYLDPIAPCIVGFLNHFAILCQFIEINELPRYCSIHSRMAS